MRVASWTIEPTVPARGVNLHTSKKAESQAGSDMREEYDFSEGVRGKYTERYARGSNVVVLNADVAEVFSDAKALNEALRVLARSAKDPRQAS